MPLLTWALFNDNSNPDEVDADGFWELAALQRNVESVGASMGPMFPGDVETEMTWNQVLNRLQVWRANLHGLIVHVPGHWIALTRPEGVSSSDNAALLCDSLWEAPFQLTATQARTFCTAIANHMSDDGVWSVYRVYD